jgi:hypothetical protein
VIRENTTLTDLDLGANFLGVAMRDIAAALRENSALQRLTLKGNRQFVRPGCTPVHADLVQSWRSRPSRPADGLRL